MSNKLDTKSLERNLPEAVPFDNDIWLLSTLKFYRNFKRYSFPDKLSLEYRQQIIEILENLTLTSANIDNPRVIRARDLDVHQKGFIAEHYYWDEILQNAYRGEGFIIDKSLPFLGVINLHDHLNLQITEYEEELEKAWNKLVAIESEIGHSLEYAFSPRFGFMTANPEKCGTGFVGRLFLQLPALQHTGMLSKVLIENSCEYIATSSLGKKHDDYLGSIVILYNNVTIGVTEEEILSKLHRLATKMMVAEKAVRTSLVNQPNLAIENKVLRALGMLKYSKQISSSEAFDALGLIKLGLALKLISGKSCREINELMMISRKSHLHNLYGWDVSHEDLLVKRADLLSKRLGALDH
ncbi:MAG: hypothetical protein ACQEP8_02585 [Chlamydiota bacterium]